jgi:hypothetical protein
LRYGPATFDDAPKNFDAVAGVGDLVFQVNPLQTKIRILLPAAARSFSQITNLQSTMDEMDNAFIGTFHRYAICWSRQVTDKPVCSRQGSLGSPADWISVNESMCGAVGETICKFVFQKESIS